VSAFRPLKTLAATALALTVAVGLSGCISLFPKVKPAGLYRFGDSAPVAAAKGPPATLVGVLKAPTVFTRAAAGDRLLTMTGAEAAYVAGARWVSPAGVLFDEAVSRAFYTDSGRARLIGRGEAGKADAMLRLEVRAFETDYVNGADAPPEVVVQVRAVLTRTSDRALIGDKVFDARVPASVNRVGAIVQAYDQSVDKVLTDTVAWVNAAKLD
jgi:cholesterol transport system auxiliary component